MRRFRWIEWNIDKCHLHGVQPQEAEGIVRRARRPWPKDVGHGKYMVQGQSDDGAYLQVVYVLERDGAIFVIHARPLTDPERRRYRRRQP